MMKEVSNNQSDTGMLLWHPKVHEHFNESLFYFALRFKGYRREYADTIKQDLISKGIVGICIYEIFGSYDLLIRAWLTTTMLAGFTTLLDNTNALSYYQIFRVKKIRHWAFIEDPDEGILSNMQSQFDIDRVQDDVKSGIFNSVKPYIDARLAKYYDEDRALKQSIWTTHVKFYSALTFGEFGTITKRQESEITKTLIEIQDNVIDKGYPILNMTLYFGEGLAHVLVKGIAESTVTARNFMVERVIEALRASLPELTTFAICEERPYESDDVGQDALGTFQRGVPPQWITNWFPEFYNLGGSTATVNKVQSLLVNNEAIIRNLPTERLVNLLKPLFESVITDNPENAVRETLLWFSKVEANLGSDSTWFSYLRALTGQGGKEVRHISRDIKKSVKIEKEDSQTLVDLLNKYVWALEKYRPESPLVTAKTPTRELGEIRNMFAHGTIFSRFNSVWENFFNLLMWFLPLYEGISIIAKMEGRIEDVNK